MTALQTDLIGRFCSAQGEDRTYRVCGVRITGVGEWRDSGAWPVGCLVLLIEDSDGAIRQVDAHEATLLSLEVGTLLAASWRA